MFVPFDRDKVAASASLTSRAGVPPLLGYHQGLVPYEGTAIQSILFQLCIWLKALWIELLCCCGLLGKLIGKSMRLRCIGIVCSSLIGEYLGHFIVWKPIVIKVPSLMT